MRDSVCCDAEHHEVGLLVDGSIGGAEGQSSPPVPSVQVGWDGGMTVSVGCHELDERH